DAGFFEAVVQRIDVYQHMNILLASVVGATAVFIYVREARTMAPIWVAVIGLLIWLVSTPATLMSFLSPSNESFALLINAMFLCALIRLARDAEFSNRVTIFAALVSASAYLNKLSFINISLALACTGVISLVVRKPGWKRGVQSVSLFVLVSIGAI